MKFEIKCLLCEETILLETPGFRYTKEQLVERGWKLEGFVSTIFCFCPNCSGKGKIKQIDKEIDLETTSG